jgi:hypothetical protein
MIDLVISLPNDYNVVIMLVIIKICKITWARGSVFGSDTMLQADRSRVHFPKMSLDFQLT